MSKEMAKVKVVLPKDTKHAGILTRVYADDKLLPATKVKIEISAADEPIVSLVLIAAELELASDA